MPEYYIGLMSGTSIDAIDAVLLDTTDDKFTLLHTVEQQIPEPLKQDIIDLCSPGDNEIERMGKLDNQLAELFASACHSLLETSKLTPNDIRAIGSHGQTIRHHPNREHGFTLQIGNPALIAEQTSITTVADFRRADVAAGGQGAPLVPAFHQAVFANSTINRVILNIGGMANISILQNGKVSGFDTGPGNVLLNSWIQNELNHSYDDNGNWAKQHETEEGLLKQMLEDKYFQLAPPKSTGREHFNLDWITQQLKQYGKTLKPGTIQACLTELTAETIANAITQHANCEEVYVCGGGAYNTFLMELLRDKLKVPVRTTSEIGIEPSYVEAAAFAWFAKQTLNGLSSNVPEVTGAKHPVIMGAIYPR